MANKKRIAGQGSETVVRVARFEIQGLTPDQKSRWMEVSRQCQQVVNCIWRSWLLWHVQNDSESQMREALARDKAWREAKARGEEVGERGKWPVHAVNAALQKAVYDEVKRRFPTVHSRALDLEMNATLSKVGQIKSAYGALPGWLSILFCNQSLPSCTRGIPIRFDRANAEIEKPDGDGNWKLTIRLSRVPPANGKKVGTSVAETVELRTKSRNCRGQTAILEKIASGEYTGCGSNLMFDRGKWFALICYKMPAGAEKLDLDANRTAFLGGGLAWPWHLRMPDRKSRGWPIRPGGNGVHVKWKREKVMGQRRARQQNYRQAGSSNKGHGRNRTLGPLFRLTQYWKDFVKTCNYTVARQVIDACIAARVGRIVYFQPCGRFADSRFLARAGKRDDVPESSGWDWYQVGARLAVLCQEKGIELVVHKVGERRNRGGLLAG